jgi:hypothetical protein
MTANQFRAALAKVKLSQVKAAKLFGVNERTARRWALSERPVPEDVADDLRNLALGRLTVQEIENARR